jgi:hypothetical protein
LRPHTPSSRLSSELLKGSIGTEGSYPGRAGSELTTSSSSPFCRASSENQLGQEGRHHTGRGVADEHRLVDPALGTFPVDEEAREQQQQVELEKDEGHGEYEDEGPQQEVNGVEPVVTAERVSGSQRPAIRRPLLPNRDPSPEPSHDEAGYDSQSDDELNNADLDENNGKPCPMKRKRPSSSQDGPTCKKLKHRLRQRSTGQHRPRSKPHGRSPKSHPALNQGSRVAAVPSPQARPFTPNTTDIDMLPDCGNINRSSGDVLPTLTEVTFRLHSPHCCSFTAVIRDGCDKRGSLSASLAGPSPASAMWERLTTSLSSRWSDIRSS